MAPVFGRRFDCRVDLICNVAVTSAQLVFAVTVRPDSWSHDGDGRALPLGVEDTVKLLPNRVHHFLVSEDGPTAVEYAVMLALIIIVCLVAINSLGTNANQTFNDVAASMSGS